MGINRLCSMTLPIRPSLLRSRASLTSVESSASPDKVERETSWPEVLKEITSILLFPIPPIFNADVISRPVVAGGINSLPKVIVSPLLTNKLKPNADCAPKPRSFSSQSSGRNTIARAPRISFAVVVLISLTLNGSPLVSDRMIVGSQVLFV